MDKKIYYITNNKNPYSFKEIVDQIMDGKLVKESFLWKEGLKDWQKLKDFEEFQDELAKFDKIAEEQLKKMLGEDEESKKNKELQSILLEANDEEIDFAKEKKPLPIKNIVILIVLLFVSAGIYFFYAKILNEKPVAKKIVAKKEEKIDTEKMKFSSGIMKIDKIEKIKVKIKKISKAEEKAILKEALVEIKREKKQKKLGQHKNTSIFDTVSDSEVANFRNSMFKNSNMRLKTRKIKTDDKFFKGADELSSRQVAKVVKKNYKYIKYCYNKALKTDVNLHGKMEVTIHILGTGRVAKVVDNTKRFHGTNMDRCVKNIIKKKWIFPKFNGTLTTVTIPFVLSAN